MAVASQSTAIATPQHQQPHQPHLPQHISAQICVAVEASDERSVEIRLDPEELGRLRIVLSPKDGGIVVTVFSEKPEVLDLMRRNTNQLETDFSDIGYDGASFSFRKESRDADDLLDAPSSKTNETTPVSSPPEVHLQIDGTTTSLDLRL
ncbi:flagellar hook-length control protein FliK [Litoreibacter albidus]|nr:flagellar hook-length control protein FliK [Litoreibacter albidus]